MPNPAKTAQTSLQERQQTLLKTLFHVNFLVDGPGCNAFQATEHPELRVIGNFDRISLQGKCKFNKDYAITNISQWAIMPKNEDSLAYALWKVGPIAVSLNAAPKSFQLYKNGIYDDEASCDNTKVNHAMLLVGYTPTYWILKNWWGTWGDGGYMKLARGKNMCGVSNYAAYVTIK
ncbi:cathepsin M-like [Toxorhynchites rutilus septentrionalis]|uniref:cathepsin M-like n=1 Tax=Toxorhynchites rutilus septentrionalis TaxID=329112 RepID=UPI00247AF637|nr:cathepsin M-like [Toxorhynchites rutilus septentrionalis]